MRAHVAIMRRLGLRCTRTVGGADCAGGAHCRRVCVGCRALGGSRPDSPDLPRMPDVMQRNITLYLSLLSLPVTALSAQACQLGSIERSFNHGPNDAAPNFPRGPRSTDPEGAASRQGARLGLRDRGRCVHWKERRSNQLGHHGPERPHTHVRQPHADSSSGDGRSRVRWPCVDPGRNAPRRWWNHLFLRNVPRHAAGRCEPRVSLRPKPNDDQQWHVGAADALLGAPGAQALIPDGGHDRRDRLAANEEPDAHHGRRYQ